MAYNTTAEEIKQTMLDKASNQEIHGTKTFLNGVGAKQFKLLDGTLLTPTAIETISNNTPNALLICNGNRTATGTTKLVYENDTLKGEEAVFSSIEASGKKLREIPAPHIEGVLPAATLPLYNRGALSIRNQQLTVDLTNVLPINTRGQTLADADLLLVYDTSNKELRQTTLQRLYNDYINSKIQHPAGQKYSLQFKKGIGFGASSNLSFDEPTNTLHIKGHAQILSLEVSGPLHARSAIYQSLRTIVSEEYEVQKEDYTLIADITNNNICITIPDAPSAKGRILNIKVVHFEKDVLSPNSVILKSDVGMVDLCTGITLNTHLSCCTVQSDGENWWIINGQES
jgi:hypothetical protein